jgi:hypothetical protein
MASSGRNEKESDDLILLKIHGQEHRNANSGPGGRRFKSSLPDQFNSNIINSLQAPARELLLSGVTQKVTHKEAPTLLWVTLPMPKTEVGGLLIN